MAVRGIGASFQIGKASSPSDLQDVSSYLNKIDKSSDVDRLDATTFQPNVAAPLKVEIAGFRTRGFTLSGVWTKAADDFFASIEGAEGLDYQYGPEGTTSGKQKLTGTVNCLNYSGAQSEVSGITSFTVDLSITQEDAASTFA